LPPIFFQNPPHYSGLEATSVFFTTATMQSYGLNNFNFPKKKSSTLLPLELKGFEEDSGFNELGA